MAGADTRGDDERFRSLPDDTAKILLPEVGARLQGTDQRQYDLPAVGVAGKHERDRLGRPVELVGTMGHQDLDAGILGHFVKDARSPGIPRPQTVQDAPVDPAKRDRADMDRAADQHLHPSAVERCHDVRCANVVIIVAEDGVHTKLRLQPR